MGDHREYLRIKSPTQSMLDVYTQLSERNPGAMRVLFDLSKKSPMLIFLVDSKHLYGSRIWELYKDICGEDIDRTIYHLEIELPCQICGELSVTGPYSARMTQEENRQFFAARPVRKPNSFWALENPPKDPNYGYPITVQPTNAVEQNLK